MWEIREIGAQSRTQSLRHQGVTAIVQETRNQPEVKNLLAWCVEPVETMRRATAVGVDEIEAVYRAQLGPLRRVARAITGDAETARDVVQDAFASAISGRLGYRTTGSLDAWIWRIVVNRAISERRRLTRATRLADIGRRPELSLNGSAGEPAPRLAAALAQLPERQRLAVFLRYFADLDYEAIAAVLGITTGTVGASLHAARKTLRAALAAEEVTNE